MAITFQPPVEPLAGSPGEDFKPTPKPLVLAESQAGKSLQTIIERYCRREIAGRSVLIAGHRGAGKTTLVKAAIQKLRRDDSLKKDAIPLYVEIHGPDLLGGETVLGQDTATTTAAEPDIPEPKPDTSADKQPAASSATSTDAKSDSKQQDKDEIKQALTSLRVLTIALHRAFVTDLGWAFERSASTKLPDPSTDTDNALTGVLQERAADVQELAAQLRLDFDDLVETGSLRWMWARAQRLNRGVLRPGASARDVADAYFSKQGLLEIVAATCVSDSFMRGVAKVDDTESMKAEAELKQEVEKIKERKGLVNTIAGLVAGGLAGSGLAFTSADSAASKSLFAGLTFILVTAITTLLLNYTSVRNTSRKRSRERNIHWDRSVASLDLMLPLAISRILDAGLAPIFVIDELDKVNNIEKKLERLINRLKHIVADRALFCFLVDRPYFERIQKISRVRPQAKEHTFFSERLFVIATPAQWRDYLYRVLPISPSNMQEEVQRLALTYLLLARSKMHAIDLRREVDALPQSPATPGLLDLPNYLGLPVYRNMIFMQAVVEYILEDDTMKSRLQRDANFAPYAYDALYYLLRQWEQDKAPAVSRDLLKIYLQHRMSGISKPTATQAGN